MANLTLYTAGSISFTNGSNAIVGVGTTFTALLQGDPVFGPDSKWYELDIITDDTHVTLTSVYLGATAAGSPGGTGWTILKSAKSRDSVRTATKQLTDITSVYRRVINLTNSDQTVRLDKATPADRAGLILQKADLDLFQAGTFEDDEFSIRYLLANAWTKAIGVDPQNGGFSLYSQLLLGNILTPLAFTATVNNFAPAGIDQANIIRISTSGARALTGIAAGADGRVLAIMNVGTSPLDLENEGGTSTGANRFALTGNTTVPAGGSTLLIYDGTAQRWRQIGGGGAGGAGDGEKGWSPVLAYPTVSGRVVARIVDWTGGEGDKPATGAYIGAAGPVTLPADAISVQGPKGDQVEFRVNIPDRMVQWAYVGSLDWHDLIAFGEITGPPTALEWNFSTATTDADPGDGNLRFNNATFANVDTIYIDTKNRLGVDSTLFVGSFDDSSSLPNRGTLVLLDTIDQTKFCSFQIKDAIVTAAGYLKIPVTPISGAIFTNTARLSVIFTRTGDKGIPGLIPRGTYNADTSYLVGDVVDLDGSSYISLVQPNLNHTPPFESTNTYWSLFARGVNSAFVTAINASLAASQAARNLSSDWAIKTSATVEGSEFSSKEYARGTQAGTGGSSKNWASQAGDVTGAAANSRSAKSWSQENLTGATLGGSARDWAITITGTVDGTLFSAREYAQGAQSGTGGSAKNWAQQLGADITGGTANSRSAKSWAQERNVGATLGGSSKDWAIEVTGTVNGVLYSAKEYAQGIQTGTGGSAKNWASQIGTDITGAAALSRSAKSWAQDDLVGVNYGGSARNWAVYNGGPVDGTFYSARYYAERANDALIAFQATYYGPLAADPSVDPFGLPPTEGDMYFNTVSKKLRVFTSTVWDFLIPASTSGDFSGPGASGNGNIVVFDGVTGKTGRDSGIAISSLGDLAFKNVSQLADPVAMAIVFGA